MLSETPKAESQIEAVPEMPSERVSPITRAIHATASVSIIALLGWWSWYSDSEPSLREVVTNPAAFDGHQVSIGSEAIVESVESEFFVIRVLGFQIRVTGAVHSSQIGEFVFVRGTFQPPPRGTDCHGLIEPAEYRIARGRHAKIWLSVIPVLWIGYRLVQSFRVNPTLLSIEPRT